jgi:16S rRNA (adenine1518-N6/adenine1519-N6)-dimethyltransferase
MRANVTSPSELRRLLANYGVRPAKRLGQSFLVDANVVAKILAAAAIGGDDSVFEVGAGAGALTVALAASARRVVALEIDRRLVELLDEVLGDAPNVSVVQGDILAVDVEALLGGGSWKLLANLPYSVVGPAIARLMQHAGRFSLMALMVQREVAQRCVAAPGSRQYGALSVMVQARARVTIAGQIARTCFYPQPRVDSTLVRLEPREQCLVAVHLEPAFRALVRGVFRQRRKMMLNALAGASELELTRQQARQVLEAAGIEAERRPESLSAEDFAALARALSAAGA